MVKQPILYATMILLGVHHEDMGPWYFCSLLCRDAYIERCKKEWISHRISEVEFAEHQGCDECCRNGEDFLVAIDGNAGG